jgi:translation initiation factor IF-2
MNKTKDDQNADDKPQASGKLSLGGGKGTLSLKANVGPQVRQNIAHGGRGNNVSVEVRRKRVGSGSDQASGGAPDVSLTSDEMDSRARALQAALAEGGQRKSSLPQRRITIEDKKKEEAEKAADAAAEARQKELEELQRIEGEEGKRTVKDPTAAPPPANIFRGDPRKAAGRFAGDEDEEGGSYRDRMKKAAAKPGARRPEEEDARIGRRLTIQQALNEDYERERGKSLAAQKRAREKARLAAMGAKQQAQKIFREVILPEAITVGELAIRMSEPGSEVIKSLMKMGVMANITQVIDADTAELVIGEFGHKFRRVTDADVEIGLTGDDDDVDLMLPRAPVVTIMGHVDHGKTSLLDALRLTDVVSGEAGGITQHIGAYQVTTKAGNKITFLDTPGHAAFTEMRARGANVTDIVVIVVSAEDSVMPQTIEAISHAKAAKVPIIIAINKIDLPAADPQKIKQDLLQYEVFTEEMGGDVLAVEVSAKKKIGLDKLEEAIMLQAEILDLKANPSREAHGTVIESKMEKGRGSVASVLITKGTLRVGDVFVAGAEFGKVRAIINDHGKNIQTAGPGQPVEVLGLNGTPDAGDSFSVVKDENRAREIADYRARKKRESQSAQAMKGRATMDDLLLQRKEGEKTTLPVIIKGDVHGSVEAIASSLQKMATDNEAVAVQVLHSGVGGITESDVTLARASKALIIGFNVRANAQARDLAQRDGVDMRYYNIIYNVIDDAKAILTGMLSPTKREEYLGQAQVRQVFNITKVGKIAGCMVTVGNVKRGAKVRLLRDDVVIHEGMLKTLKRFKDEVKEVKEGMECGMAFENYDDLKENDIIECFEIIEETRKVN